MSKDNKSPTPLSVMLGAGESFMVKDKKYTIEPIELQDVEEFANDEINIGSQLFNIVNKEQKSKMDRWLGGKRDKDGNLVKSGYCFDEDGNPVTLEIAMTDRWNVVDLKTFLRKLCDLSG